MIDIINEFSEEKVCSYKGEKFLARDNGAIMRLPKNGKVRVSDNQWTFGIKNYKNGYMFFNSSIRVHQVIATAFYGKPADEEMVVDHIDTNRCNNRKENLRWVTKLENALNNPITRKKIIYCCGSIEAFLNDPSILRENAADPNVTWMRTVTKEEAAKCTKNLDRWTKEDQIKPYSGNGLGEWIFNDLIEEQKKGKVEPIYNYERDSIEQPVYFDSLTSNAIQGDWKTPTEFPLCPSFLDTGIEQYFANLKIGETFCKNIYGESKIIDFAISEDKNEFWVITTIEESVKPFALTSVSIVGEKFLHQSMHQYFQEDGVRKYFTLAQGKEWTGGEVFDDYC